MKSIKNIIAVASGKGGVGKSTVSANLAAALASQGAQVGLLDADIYGPNQPQMFGIQGQPESLGEHRVKPMEAHGVKLMSIGLLISGADTPMVWRGPMASMALQQMLNETEWEELDYLIIDLPPGTGDIQLTLAQKIPVTAALIVTTPQDIALLDVRKAIRMFEKVQVPVVGVVENMSFYHCSQCQHEDKIFGEGGAAHIEQEFNLPVLGTLPLVRDIREQADQGMPIVLAKPDSTAAKAFYAISHAFKARLEHLLKSAKSKFPKIVIEKK